MSAKKALSELTVQDVERMNYAALSGVMRETVRPPGGFSTVLRLAELTGLNPSKRVLEVGTSTGFGAHELAWLTGCRVDAVDIEANCLEEGRRRAAKRGLSHLINFQLDNAMDLSFADGTFDVLFCGNMTSLLPDQDKAFFEYTRVLKPGGILAATPFYYVDEFPPPDLHKKVSIAQGADFVPIRKVDAMKLYNRPGLDPMFFEDYRFDRISDETLARFMDGINSQPHLDQLAPDTRKALAIRYHEVMRLFRDNLTYMGFTLSLWRKDLHPVDPELFTVTRVS